MFRVLGFIDAHLVQGSQYYNNAQQLAHDQQLRTPYIHE